MKHNIKITIILLSMFLITQFIGIYVINSDPFHVTTEINGTIETVSNPTLSWIEPPKIEQESDFNVYLGSIIFAFVIAILIILFLTKFKIDFILKAWFFYIIYSDFPKNILFCSSFSHLGTWLCLHKSI